MGVDVRLNTPAPSVEELKKQGYTHILFAVGAWKAGRLDVSGNVKPVIAWMRDVKAGKMERLGHVGSHAAQRRPGLLPSQRGWWESRPGRRNTPPPYR